MKDLTGSCQLVKWQNSYNQLPAEFYQLTTPSAAQNPQLIIYNQPLAEKLTLNFEQVSSTERTLFFSGKKSLEKTKPLAMAYAGHQFGHFVPQLGDGRAILLGEVQAADQKLYDIHLKGAGQTVFSRQGDGRSSLGPVLREYLVSESMHNLGIPTTRSLAVVTTGETVYRENALPGAMLTRVASSHIRIGTFEYFACRELWEHVQTLADYSIQRVYPHIQDGPDKYLHFFREVGQRNLKLVARWMGVGFIHGVMNTDNMSIAGETLDFGPCAFMDDFQEHKVFSSIDRHGRYAYHNQSKSALWNLSSLASCLLPLIHAKKERALQKLNDEMQALTSYFEQQWLQVMTKKLGLFEVRTEDKELIENILHYFEEKKLDFTNSFRQLETTLLSQPQLYQQWKQRVENQVQGEHERIILMNQINPYLIARNHQVEKVIQAGLNQNYQPFYKLLKATERPYLEEEQFKHFTLAPEPQEVVHQTFCGT